MSEFLAATAHKSRFGTQCDFVSRADGGSGADIRYTVDGDIPGQNHRACLGARRDETAFDDGIVKAVARRTFESHWSSAVRVCARNDAR
jgi:hypothetical protein